MPPAGFKPAIPAGERLQTHALDRSATGIGTQENILSENTVATCDPRVFLLMHHDGMSHLKYI